MQKPMRIFPQALIATSQVLLLPQQLIEKTHFKIMIILVHQTNHLPFERKLVFAPICMNVYKCVCCRHWCHLERLDKYLWSKELEEDAVMKLPLDSQSLVVKVECASFKWDSKK